MNVFSLADATQVDVGWWPIAAGVIYLAAIGVRSLWRKLTGRGRR